MTFRFLFLSCFLFSINSFAGVMGSLPATKSSFSGFYAGGAIGGSFTTASEIASNSSTIFFPGFFLGNVALTNNSASNLESKMKEDAGIAALYIGYGLNLNKFYLGTEIFGTLSQYKMRNALSTTHSMEIINSIGGGVVLDPTITSTNSWTTTAKVSPVQWGIDLRPGFLANANLLLYGRVGVARATLSMDSNFANNSPYQLIVTGAPFPSAFNQASSTLSLSNSKNVNALRLGGGVEYSITPCWSIRMDYTHIQYGKIQSLASSRTTIPSDPPVDGTPFFGPGTLAANHNIEIKNVASNTVMVGFSYYFS